MPSNHIDQSSTVEELLNHYQPLAATTAKYSLRFHYSAEGLVGEFGEFLSSEEEVDEVSELGDIAWYFAAMCTDLGISMGSLVVEGVKYSVLDVLKNLAKLMNQVKKIHRDDGDFPTQERKDRIFLILRDLWGSYIGFIEEYDHSLGEILEKNLDKLFDRKDRDTISGDGDNR